MKLLAAIAVLSACCVHAAEPLTLKELMLGDSEEVLRAAYPEIKCTNVNRPVEKTPPDRRCDIFLMHGTLGYGELLLIGDETAELTTLLYTNDQLGEVSFYMGSGSFDRIVSSLRAKYGPPSSRSTERVQNQMGAQFMNEIVRWQRNGQIIEAEKYYQRIDRMMLSLYSLEFRREEARQQRQAVKKAAGKL